MTPNRLTAVALSLGVGAAVCFATGRLRIGGALFVLRFFVDCLDGRVARLQGTSSARGASFDLGADVLGVTASYAALGWWLADAGHLDPAWAVALLAAVCLYNWELEHRKHLAAGADLGTGGAAHRWRPRWHRCAAGSGSASAGTSRRCPGRWSARSPRSGWRRCCSLRPRWSGRSGPHWRSTSSPICSMPTGSADHLTSRQPWRPQMITNVDVVIATHHRPELLRRRSPGVTAQDVNCEITILVVFDRSEPDLSLVSELPGRRVRVIRNTRSPGLAGARNTGILAG